MPAYAYLVMAVGTILWCVPFVFTLRTGGNILRIDKRARWGLLLEAVAYSLLWQGSFWLRSPGIWRVAVSVAFFALACALSWTGARALGKQLRVDAALGPDHELVRTGPYRWLRHPIYTSMLCILLGTGLLLAAFPMLLLATAVFLAGTEIRVRIEDRLLASQFGEAFRNYQHSVPAYLPFLK